MKIHYGLFLLVPLLANSIHAQTAIPAKPAAQAAQPKPQLPKPQPMSAAECAVWKRELSYSQSVDNKNIQAFADHIHQGAVFNAGSPYPVRGREAIVQDWAQLLKGDQISIKWRPGRVTIGGDSTIAISRGPMVLENKTKGAKPRYKVGTFNTIWVKGSDGVWRVQFDGTGAPPMGTDNAADVQKFMAKAPKSCNG
jgi:ketosteroid isomerase-like protein